MSTSKHEDKTLVQLIEVNGLVKHVL